MGEDKASARLRALLMLAAGLCLFLSACGEDGEPVEKCSQFWWVDGDPVSSERCIMPSRVEAVREEVFLLASRYFDPVEVSAALTGLKTHFDADRIECGVEKGCGGVFRFPDRVEVHLTSDCIGATSYAHELSHAILYDIKGVLGHGDPRFFVQRTAAGELLDIRQRNAAIEVKASLNACAESCSGFSCTAAR